MARKGTFARLQDHFHEHPRGRLHEFLFWSGLGLAVGVAAFIGWRKDVVNDAFAWIFAVVAACLVLWALLPQRRRPPQEAPPGRLRAERAAAVKASKEEGKRFRAAKRGGR